MIRSFHSLAYSLFVFLTLFLPLLLIGSAALITLAFVRSAPQNRRAGLRAVLASGGFVLLDALMLKALPWLGFSYGPVTFALVFLSAVRAACLLVWSGLLIYTVRQGGRSFSSLPFWFANLALTGLVLYSFYIEPFQIQVTRIEVRTEHVRQPVRLVQLSDIHVERATRRERALIPLVQRLQPDLIVMTGDYLNLSYLGDATALSDAQEIFLQLSAPYGMYAVNGSVDNEARMQALFAGTRVTILDDQVEQVDMLGGKIALLGVSNWATDHDPYSLARLAASLPKDAFSLLLFHTPDLIDTAADNGIDLYLAGHTHGGQLRLPLYGAIITASDYGKQYEAGRYQVDQTTLYVSRGLGMEGGMAPRFRFLAPPEVVVIDLIPLR